MSLVIQCGFTLLDVYPSGVMCILGCMIVFSILSASWPNAPIACIGSVAFDPGAFMCDVSTHPQAGTYAVMCVCVCEYFLMCSPLVKDASAGI